jgi:hypothetical protein
MPCIQQQQQQQQQQVAWSLQQQHVLGAKQAQMA